MCVCTTCEPGAHGIQKKVSDPLEPEGQMVMSHYVGGGN